MRTTTAMDTLDAPSPAAFDRASLFARVDEDDDLLVTVLEVFLDDTPHVLRAIDRALARQDLSVLQREAHTLAVAAAGISADALHAAAHALEQTASRGELLQSAAGARVVKDAFAAVRPVLARQVQGEDRA